MKLDGDDINNSAQDSSKQTGYDWYPGPVVSNPKHNENMIFIFKEIGGFQIQICQWLQYKKKPYSHSQDRFIVDLEGGGRAFTVDWNRYLRTF